MSRFIVIVIDSFGIGYMDDVPIVRPQDLGANTCKNILLNKPFLKLKNLESLGLINSLGEKVNVMNFNNKANFGVINLAHEGGDTFMGHQEIMGTKPKIPKVIPFKEVSNKIKSDLDMLGYHTRYYGLKNRIIVVNDSLTIGDNIEADLGQVYNVSADFNKISFDEVIKIAEVVRKNSEVSRVIAFGGTRTNIAKILDAYIEIDCYGAIHTPNSGIYEEGFKVIHLGYGINSKLQIPHLLFQNGIKTFLFGKVADIVDNPNGINYKKIVDTKEIFTYALKNIKKYKTGFFCINIQETDLAGHNESTDTYANILEISDKYIGNIIEELSEDDILVITADHGNDPTIGHNKHTREKVPLLLYKNGLECHKFGVRHTLGDIGASVLKYFGIDNNVFGKSFLDFKSS